MSIDGLKRPSSGCFRINSAPVVFLQFESPRARIALPYASLLSMALALDDAQIELAFATHRVSVRGKNLRSIYEALAQALASQIMVPEPRLLAAPAFSKEPLVREIQIKAMDSPG